MQTLEDQIRAAKVGDEIVLRCGPTLVITSAYAGDVFVQGSGWASDGRKTGTAGGDHPLDIIRVIPKLEDGWTRWEGGECPVNGFANVEIRLRGFGTNRGCAGGFAWRRSGCSSDIVAYRVVKETTSIRDRLKGMVEDGRKDGLIHRSTFDELLRILIDREAA